MYSITESKQLLTKTVIIHVYKNTISKVQSTKVPARQFLHGSLGPPPEKYRKESGSRRRHIAERMGRVGTH